MPLAITAALAILTFNFPQAKHNVKWVIHQTSCIVKHAKPCPKEVKP